MTGLVLLASRVACLIMIAWFVVFAVDQSKTAATHQLGELAGTGQQSQARAPGKPKTATKVLDEAAKVLTSPFASLTSGRSAWAEHGLDTLIALLIYGFGVGFVIRFLRVRV